MEELIKQCRYYKGEKECPRDIDKKGKCLYWNYEKIWVESDKWRDEKIGEVSEYVRYGLKEFNKDDGTPITLKALLFNRYEHWSGNYGNLAEGFKVWYIESYLKGK